MSIRYFDSTQLSLCAKYSLQGRKETIQYNISPESLHALLKRLYMFTDGRNTEKSYSLNYQCDEIN